VERKAGQVLSVSDTSVQLMDLKDFSTIDVPITDDLKPKLEAGKEVAYLSSMGKVKMDLR